MRASTAALAVCVLMLVASATAEARNRACRSPGLFRDSVAALNLDTAQDLEMAELRSGLINRRAAIRAELQMKVVEGRALWATGEPDRRAILTKGMEIDALRGRLREVRVDFALAALRVLTPDQLQRLGIYNAAACAMSMRANFF